MLVGLIQPTAGTILFSGQPILADLDRHKQRTGYVPEEPYLYTGT
jgi:ABC-type multidrug transport system ATPase subunit